MLNPPTRRSERLTSDLNKYLTAALVADRLREAERFRRSRSELPEIAEAYETVTVRLARAADAEGIRRLSQLEGRRSPQGAILVAEVNGTVLVARSLDGDGSVADPFRPTAQLTELLELRSAHLRSASNGQRRGVRRWLGALGRRTWRA